MMKETLNSEKEIRESYEKAGQGHIFKFYDNLSDEQKGSLLGQLSEVDPKEFDKLAATAQTLFTILNNSAEQDSAKNNDDIVPLPASSMGSLINMKNNEKDKLFNDGLDIIAKNTVAAVLLAGGQGTRLGSDAPKGCFDIGLPSGKTLFQLQAERVLRLQTLAEKRLRKTMKKHESVSVVIPWYIMTSGPTDQATKAFFTENKFFGLDKKNVIFFEQHMLPCISEGGKMILESHSKIAQAPDGNGGLYKCLLTRGVLDDMKKRGIEHVNVYCVDNCLVKVADPTFIAFAAERNALIATKVVRKKDVEESVGLIVQKHGKPAAIEYTEIDSERAAQREGGEYNLLRFRAANIVNHYYSIKMFDNLGEWVDKLPYHVAHKKIPYCDLETENEHVKPEKPNGFKLEKFIFDCFPFVDMDRFACLEVFRSEEFSPLKNAAGKDVDDPDTSRRDLMFQGSRWLEYNSAIVDGEGGVEVSPLVSYKGEDLEKFFGKTVKSKIHLDPEYVGNLDTE